MTQEQYEAAYLALNAQRKSGEIPTDAALLDARKALQAQRNDAAVAVKAEAQAEAKANTQHAKAELIRHDQVQTLGALDGRATYLENKLRNQGHKLKPSDYVASQVLLRSAKEQLSAAARLMGVDE